MQSSQAEPGSYRVVVNDEEQYSVWFADRELPPGWHDEGTVGTKEQCLAHISAVWTDIRPKSLRVGSPPGGHEDGPG